MKQLHVIQMTLAEIQSKSDRVTFAEGLIKQLPPEHEGRNTWLINYGKSDEAKVLRNRWELENSRALEWDPNTESSKPIS